ncbi:MAG: S8 family serine peptidase [Tepidisphaeraceae bacterium]
MRPTSFTHGRSRSSAPSRPLAQVTNRAQVDALESRRLFTDTPWGANPRLIRQDLAANSYPNLDGAGQTIVIVDTGIDYTNPAFNGTTIGPANQVIAGYDFYDNDADPMDTDGHGTQVAGMIGSRRFESGGFLYQGIAPGAKLIALRISPSRDNVALDKIESALQWIIANANTYSIDVVNISFGYGRFDSEFSNDILSDELATIYNKGIFITTSSGNGGMGDGVGITYPAADPKTLSVGAVDSSDVIADFTQRSNYLNFLAPGVDVRTPSTGGGFAMSSGTSYAAPIVAGLIALVRQAEPNFTYGDVLSVLRASSRPNLDGDTETGTVTNKNFARIDVYGALSLANQRKAASSEVQAAIGFAGNNNAVAVDGQGVTHLLYYDSSDDQMKYATKQKSGQWSAPQIVDSTNLYEGQYLSMALDRWGRPNISYFDGTAGDLKFAQLNSLTDNAGGVTWKIETVDAQGSVGLYNSITLGSDDTPHISYYRRSSGDLRLASRYPTSDGNGGTNNWRILDVDTADDVGRSSAITLDRNGRLVIAYESSTMGKVRVARQNNSLSSGAFPVWNLRTVTNATAESAKPALSTVGAGWISVAIDSANRAHLAYYNIGPADLNYAKLNDDGTFSIASLQTKKAVGQYTQVFLESDQPRILFMNRATASFNQARLTNGTWTVSTLASEAGRFIDLAPDASRPGKYVYSYYKNSTASLVLAST